MTKEELERALTASEAHRQEQDHEIRALKELLRKQDSEKSDLQIKLQAALAPIRRDTYSEAVRTYGKQSQLIMAMEEMPVRFMRTSVTYGFFAITEAAILFLSMA